MDWPENEDVNTQNVNFTTAIHEAVSEAVRQWEKNKRKKEECGMMK